MCSAGTLVGRASYPPQSQAPTTLEYEAAIPGGPPAVDGGDRLRRDWLKAASMKCDPTPMGLPGSSALGQSGCPGWPSPGCVISWQLTWSLGDPDWPCVAYDSWQAVGRGSGNNQVRWRWGTRAALGGGHVPRATEEASRSEQVFLKSLPCHILYQVGQSKTQPSPESRNQEGIHLLMKGAAKMMQGQEEPLK